MGVRAEADEGLEVGGVWGGHCGLFLIFWDGHGGRAASSIGSDSVCPICESVGRIGRRGF